MKIYWFTLFIKVFGKSFTTADRNCPNLAPKLKPRRKLYLLLHQIQVQGVCKCDIQEYHSHQICSTNECQNHDNQYENIMSHLKQWGLNPYLLDLVRIGDMLPTGVVKEI